MAVRVVFLSIAILRTVWMTRSSTLRVMFTSFLA